MSKNDINIKSLQDIGFYTVGSATRKSISHYLELCYTDFDEEIHIQTKGSGFSERTNFKGVNQITEFINTMNDVIDYH